MEWINLHISSQIRHPAYVGSSPAERGTWLSVLAYACEIECGGTLVGAALWKDRQWQQACGVTRREVAASSRLLRVVGDDVEVNGYPIEKEGIVRGNRINGGLGGKMKTQAKTEAARTNGAKGGRPRNPSENPTEGEGEEEGEGEGHRHGVQQPLGTWIRTGTKDRDRTLENRQALADLIKRFSLEKVQATAERIVFASHEKIWPDDPRLLAALIADTKPKAPPEEVLPDDLNALPDGHPLKPKARVRA